MKKVLDTDNLHMLKRIETAQRRPINLMGLGGVGTNVLSLLCERVANRERGSLGDGFIIRGYDMDHVELHNLNRTLLFKPSGLFKSKAVALRQNQNVLKPTIKLHDMEVTREFDPTRGLLIDARDTLDPEKILDNTWVKLAYNGDDEFAFHFKPHLSRDVIDLESTETSSYEVVPSFFVPASMLALYTMYMSTYFNLVKITDLKATFMNFSMAEEIIDASEDFSLMMEEI